MVKLRFVTDPDEKTAVTLAVMHALPAWFSPPEDINRKAAAYRAAPFFAAYENDTVVGFAALKRHNACTAEILSIGVLEAAQGQGTGMRLMAAAEEYCTAQGLVYLTAKTLDASAEYEPYERTRRFYKKMGFLPLEVFPLLWDEENPCLFQVKQLQKITA